MAIIDVHSEFGREALPVLTELLNDTDARVREGAAGAIRKIETAAKDAIPALVERLADNDPRVRLAACCDTGVGGGWPHPKSLGVAWTRALAHSLVRQRTPPQ